MSLPPSSVAAQAGLDQALAACGANWTFSPIFMPSGGMLITVSFSDSGPDTTTTLPHVLGHRHINQAHDGVRGNHGHTHAVLAKHQRVGRKSYTLPGKLALERCRRISTRQELGLCIVHRPLRLHGPRVGADGVTERSYRGNKILGHQSRGL